MSDRISNNAYSHSGPSKKTNKQSLNVIKAKNRKPTILRMYRSYRNTMILVKFK